MLKTDANARGLGAILSQEQEDNRFHPVASHEQLKDPEILEMKDFLSRGIVYPPMSTGLVSWQPRHRSLL